MAIPVTVTPYTRGGTQYYRYESPYIGSRYASGSFAAEGRTPEQAKEYATQKAAGYLNLPISEFEGHETETTGIATQERIEQAETSRARIAKLHEQREALKAGYTGEFKTEYAQRLAAAPVGTPVPTKTQFETTKALGAGTTQFSSEQAFKQQAQELGKFGAFAGVTEFKGQVVQPPKPSTQPSIPGSPYVYESPFGKGQIRKEDFPGAAKQLSTDWTAINRNMFAEQPKRSGTFTVIEGRLAQKYSFIEGQADFGKSMFGVPQGKPEAGATYRKDWFGGYTKINKPEMKTVSKEQFKAIGTSDIVAPILVPSGAFAPTSVLKGATLGIKLSKTPKVDTSGFAVRFSEYKNVPTFEPRTFKTYKTTPVEYSSPIATVFYNKATSGFIRSDDPMGLFSKEPPLELKTTLQTIDKRALKFEGTKGFTATPRESKSEPLNKLMGEYKPSSVSAGKGRQLLVQEPKVSQQVKPMGKVVVLKTEQVYSGKSYYESTPQAFRTSTNFVGMSMKSSRFSRIKPIQRLGLGISTLNYELQRVPPSQADKIKVETGFKTASLTRISPISRADVSIKVQPVLRSDTSLKTGLVQRVDLIQSQKQLMKQIQVTKSANILNDFTRSPFRPKTPGYIFSPPIIPPTVSFGLKKGKKGKKGKKKDIVAWNIRNWTFGADMFVSKKKRRK